MWAVIIIVVVIVLLALFLVGIYNGMVRGRNRVDEAWSGIDVQLKRRHDLIPNLVETVKGYAAHEKEVFEAVTQARANAMSAQAGGAASAAQIGQAEGQLSGALGRLFAVAEAYPQLRATENFQQLQAELTNTEDQIAGARRIYNGNVQSYNTRIQTFPAAVFAGMFGFEKREFFEIDSPADREVPSVSFGSDSAPPAVTPPAASPPPPASPPPAPEATPPAPDAGPQST
jgi:LemA protein